MHPGILINVAKDNDKRLNAADYARLKVINANVYSRNATIKAKLRSVDGVIVTGLINPQSGEDAGLIAYIANGTEVIEISSDQTGIGNGEQVFNLMLSTLKLWRPQKPIL